MRRALIDINIILDNYDNYRKELFPESVRLFELAQSKAKQGIFYISASSLDNIAFLKHRDLKDAYPQLSFSQREKIVKKLLTELLSIFNVCKTPSYIDPGDLTEEIDIEDLLLLKSAEACGLVLITRDEKILKKNPDRAMHPGEYLKIETESHVERIPLLDLKAQTFFMYSDIERAIDKVLRKSNFIMGEEVYEFERALAEYVGVKYAIAVASGTDALLLSLRALALKLRGEEYWRKDDLIITTPFTFTATGDTILRAGATPLFVDIDLDTYNIDPEEVKKAVKLYGKRVVGLIPVHLYGLPCNMDELMDIAQENNLFVVEDCAQSLGSKFKGKKVGSFGHAGAFSFFPTKNLGALGDAGAVTTNDEELSELVRMLRVHGGRDKYNVEHIGYKARMDTIQAGILLEKLKYLDLMNQKRREIALYYSDFLKDIKEIKIPHIPTDDYFHTYHQYTILIVDHSKRDLLQVSLRKENIETMIYYPVPLHKMKVFYDRCLFSGLLNNSHLASNLVLSLPIDPFISDIKLIQIVDNLRTIVIHS